MLYVLGREVNSFLELVLLSKLALSGELFQHLPYETKVHVKVRNKVTSV